MKQIKINNYNINYIYIEPQDNVNMSFLCYI